MGQDDSKLKVGDNSSKTVSSAYDRGVTHVLTQLQLPGQDPQKAKLVSISVRRGIGVMSSRPNLGSQRSLSKPEDVNLVSRNYVKVEGEKQLHSVVLRPAHMRAPLTHTQHAHTCT